MRISKYKDQRDILGTRTRAFQIIDKDGAFYLAGRTDYLHDLPPVEWVWKQATDRDLRPGSARFRRIMAACLDSEGEGGTLRRPADVTARIEQLADV